MSRCPRCDARWAPDHVYCPKDGARLVADPDAPTLGPDLGAMLGVPEMPVVGEALESKYELLRVIGEGGSGVVFEARHVRIGRPVAIKVLRPGVVGDETQLARFAEEARLAARVGHDGIVEILDLVVPQRRPPFIVMELLEGESLATLLHRQKTLPPPRALRIAMGILEALAAAHRCSIVHRDVKPGNVFVARKEGRGEVIKLLDFGIARALQDPMRLTQPGRAVGTAVFMPPEQLMSSDVDQRADLYAVAAVLYLMLAGEVPFDGSTWTTLARAKLSSSIRPMKLAGPNVRMLEQVVKHGLELDPDDRPQTAVDFREELEMVLDALEGGAEARSSRAPTMALAEKPRVAVVPFEATPASHPDAWAGAALALSVFDALASRRGQRLADPGPINAALRGAAPGEPVDPAALGPQVGAGYVITGELDLGGLDARVELRIIEVESREILARRVQTGELEAIFGLNAATIENIGRAFKLAPRAANAPPPLAEADFRAFREYAELDALARGAAAPVSPELLRRATELVARVPEQPGPRGLCAELALRRCETSEPCDADLVAAHDELEGLAARGTADPRVAVARARLRHTTRFFEPNEAMVLTEEQRALNGFDARVLLEQASALENLGLPDEAAALLATVTSHDRACGPALVRLATLSLGPAPAGAAKGHIERATYLLRSSQGLRAEEQTLGERAASARRGWPPLPDLTALDALLAARLRDAAAARAAIERAGQRPGASFADRAALASAAYLLQPSDQALEAMVGVVQAATARLEHPTNHDVIELACAAPDAWLPALERWLAASPGHDRLRFLASLLLERTGDLDRAIAVGQQVAGATELAALADVARRHVERLESRRGPA